ncbi:vicilin-like seed storage protein At2g18540 isoform X2 [Selaginella moellendorffii]|uniref:vicilin-like seed storage protein At2g18540 isoform X2 n=1 Tax=Selaginella moellendorffii TaxID=88036 RepID=UPI000D1CEEC7|nr:vicilin-like seed storage protein At2g18540 isoform X2 [Selaginella moellendorffii]|eukprot:XP_024521663.1 vicilin-like seed storage protein At2g18540 isoform X2 [Selaginella moellendorffii]
MFPPKQPVSPRARADIGRLPSPSKISFLSSAMYFSLFFAAAPVEQGSTQGSMVKWKSSEGKDSQGGLQYNVPQSRGDGDEAEQKKGQRSMLSSVQTMEQPRLSPNYTSMQTELLEKVKRDLEEEGCNLMEQRRRDVIEEVERQIDEERKRLQEIQNSKLQEDLELEYKLLEQKELERKRAWEERLKQEEEESAKMAKDLAERRKKTEEDVTKVLELETKSFELESLQRLNSFRAALEDEELKLIESEKTKTLALVEDKVLAEEELVAKEMKKDALGRMKLLAQALETAVYERELEVARQRAMERVEWERKEHRMKIEREVDEEVASFKEDLVKERRERMLQQVCRRICEEHRLHYEVISFPIEGSSNSKQALSRGNFGVPDKAVMAARV